MLLYVLVCVACMLLPCVGFVCFWPLLSVITSTFDTTQCSCWGRVRALRTLTTPRATTPRSKMILLRRKLAFGRSRLSRIDPPACALPQGGARVHLCSERASVISSAVMRDTKEPPGHPGLFYREWRYHSRILKGSLTGLTVSYLKVTYCRHPTWTLEAVPKRR